MTPENNIYSEVTKLSPAESNKATNRLTDIQKLFNNFKPVYKNPRIVPKIFNKVAHLELDIFQ